MELLKYNSDWEDFDFSEGIVIHKCTVQGADLAFRSPQFPDWIHIVKDGKIITVLNGLDPEKKHSPSLLEYVTSDIGELIQDLFGWDFLEYLKEYDGVFFDMDAVYRIWYRMDGTFEFDVEHLANPFNY